VYEYNITQSNCSITPWGIKYTTHIVKTKHQGAYAHGYATEEELRDEYGDMPAFVDGISTKVFSIPWIRLGKIMNANS
jgi:hypothetical protein